MTLECGMRLLLDAQTLCDMQCADANSSSYTCSMGAQDIWLRKHQRMSEKVEDNTKLHAALHYESGKYTGTA